MNRDNGTDRDNGGWLRRLVRQCVSHSLCRCVRGNKTGTVYEPDVHMCIVGNKNSDERLNSGWRRVGGVINGAIIGSSWMGWIICGAAGSKWAGKHISRLVIAVSASAQKAANQ